MPLSSNSHSLFYFYLLLSSTFSEISNFMSGSVPVGHGDLYISNLITEGQRQALKSRARD
jgi:hypothetical protein